MSVIDNYNKKRRLTERGIGCFKYHLKDHPVDTADFGTYPAFFDTSVAVMRLGELEDEEEKNVDAAVIFARLVDMAEDFRRQAINHQGLSEDDDYAKGWSDCIDYFVGTWAEAAEAARNEKMVCECWTKDGRCTGTKEIDLVGCEGDRRQCIYEERRKK